MIRLLLIARLQHLTQCLHEDEYVNIDSHFCYIDFT